MVYILKALLCNVVAAAISMMLMGCGGKCDMTALASAAQTFSTKAASCSADVKCMCDAFNVYVKAYDDNTGGCSSTDKASADAAMKQAKAAIASACGSTLVAEPSQNLLDIVAVVTAAIEQSKMSSTSPVDVV